MIDRVESWACCIGWSLTCCAVLSVTDGIPVYARANTLDDIHILIVVQYWLQIRTTQKNDSRVGLEAILF